MEEISIMVAYDAHVFSQLHDEDFLTSLVAISKPRSMVGVSLHTTLWLLFFQHYGELGSCEVKRSTAVDFLLQATARSASFQWFCCIIICL